MSEVFQNKKALYHYSPTLFLSVTTRSSAVVSDVTYLDSRSCQNLVGLGSTPHPGLYSADDCVGV